LALLTMRRTSMHVAEQSPWDIHWE